MYSRFFKRLFDFFISLIFLIIISPLTLVLIIIGAKKMKGSPFFVQKRPGKNEKIFTLIKLRTMSNEKDEEGNLLPDTLRLDKYGRFLRSTSLDELPELINILKGDMALIGPRPLAVQYLPYYNDYEKQRHKIRPGLTGWAQVNGRNSTTWENRFAHDIEYVNNVSFIFDMKIIFMTIKSVFCKSGIGERGVDSPIDFDTYRKDQLK